MKKKILFVTLLVALLACVLAISISAADFESSYANEVTTYGEGPDWANVEDTAATAVIKLENGTSIRIPAFYIFKVSSDKLFYASSGKNMDYGWISEQVGETVTGANLVALEIPAGTTGIDGSLSATTFPAIEELIVPTSITSVPSKFLRGNTVLKRLFIKQSVDADGNVLGVKTIPDYFADQNSALEVFALELDYITSVGSNAFQTSAVKELTFVGPMTKVGGAAFASCKSLTKITVNNTGDRITMGVQAFKDSSVLTSVNLNGFNLSNYLFENVNGLTGGLSVVITNVATLGEMSFKNASNLSYVEITGPLTTLGTSAFTGCHNLTTAKITNTLDTPASSSSSFVELKAIKDVTLHGIQIGYRMFYKVTTLENLTITNYTTIGNEAFANTTITSFTVPAGFTSIGERAFQNCKSLTEFNFVGNAGEKAKIAVAAFENCTLLTSFVIPEGVTTLENCAFKGSGLKSVSFPTTLTTITGGQHFWNTQLETVIGFENTAITSVSDSMFRGLKNWKPDVLRIPDTVESIGEYGFADVGAKVIIIGTGVTKLGTEAFVNCCAVEAFYIPNTITSFGGSALVNRVLSNIIYYVASDDEAYLNSVKACAEAADVVALGTYEANKDAYAKGKHVISGCNPCTLFYEGTHAMAGKEVMTLNSYFEQITFGDKCTRDGCGESVVISTINPIFVYLGHSCTEVAINGAYSMSQFFKVDDDALAQYTAKTGNTFEYGLVASVVNNPLAAENEGLIAENKTIIAKSTSFAHDYFCIGINGITTDVQKEKAITFCAYVVDNGTVYYLDGGKTLSTASQASYNDVLQMNK